MKAFVQYSFIAVIANAFKERAGFRVYRAVGAGGRAGRGTPTDPHHLERLE